MDPVYILLAVSFLMGVPVCVGIYFLLKQKPAGRDHTQPPPSPPAG